MYVQSPHVPLMFLSFAGSFIPKKMIYGFDLGNKIL